jgi:CO/xanthine dehydrogenase Mo-binding subunit
MSELSPSLQRNPDLDSWVRIDDGGTVTLFTGKVELGQGVRTAIARIGAEELDVSLARIRVQTADTAHGPNEMLTVGSGSMEESGRAMRQAAAEARRHLLELAAEHLGVGSNALEVDDGTVSAPGLDRRTTYWELFGGKRFGRAVTGDVEPKQAANYRIVGKAAERIDLAAIVTGTARFVQDLTRPGMLHGRVVRPPSPAARLESIDETRARGLPGVVAVVRDGSFLGAVAEREEQAAKAAEALRVAARWMEQETLPAMDELHEWLLAQAVGSYRVVEGVPVEGPIDPIAAPGGAAHTLEATYTRPYHMHASIGPSAALAQWTDGELTVWSHSQGVHLLRGALAQVLATEADRVRVIHVEGPGCYGHNGADDAALDAALLARAVPGRPVRLQWTREEEHAWEPYGPAMVVKIQASLDEQGRLLDWNHDVHSNTHMGRAFPYGDRSALIAAWHRASPLPPPRPMPMLFYHAGIHRNADPLYAVPQRRIVKHFVENAPLRVSSTRSLGAYANVFAIESFMDELAAAAGADPLEFRLRHLEDERARAVLRAAADRAGWAGRQKVLGRGRGIGFARYKNQKCYAAVVIDVRVDLDTAEIVAERAVIAADAGQIVDPSGLANQLEGGVIQSVSWTLKEQVVFDRTRVTSIDWDGYPILRFAAAPEVETVLLDRPGEPYLGSGEATQGPTAGAIANAVFDAVGVRLRRIPFTQDRVRAAVASTE